MKQLFIAWVPFQRRSVSMRDHFGYDLEFISLSFKNRLFRPFEYVIKTAKTLGLFVSRRPRVVWLQLPPTILLYLSYLYKLVLKRDALIIADCHNATFRKPWISLPGIVGLLNRCALVLVHSEQVEQQAKALGVIPDLVCLLEDPPTLIEASSRPYDSPSTSGEPAFYTHPWVLCPCSFNRDEPIEELIAAARLAPEITFVITGKPSRAKGIHDLTNLPSNVVLSGFLPLERFDELLLNADVVLGLTKLDGIQLSAAGEAVSTGTPMVLSATTLLKKLFYKGAIYVDSDVPESIAQGTQRAIAAHDDLTQAVIDLRRERQRTWLGQTSRVNMLLQ